MSDLASFATPREREVLEASGRLGSIAAAARELGITRSTASTFMTRLRRRAARRGFSPEHDMTKVVPDGFRVHKVSTLYDADGNKRAQWVKSSAEPDDRLAALAEAVQVLAEPFRGVEDPAPVPRRKVLDEDLLCVYPMGDPHLGMFSWRQETGQDFDLKIAERDLVAAVDHLVMLAPSARDALILNLGDFFHRDNNQNRTLRSGHPLDGDSRWAKVLSVGVRVMKRCIDRALRKHARVTVVNEIGNHDDHSAIMLALCLSEHYAREPRVTIDTSPEKFHWYRHGKCLIGVTHGDTVKPHDLPGIMAADRARDWGETEHRYWYTGHVHHDSLREFPGVTVETFRTLAPRDAWAHAAGYRSGQDMKCDVLHREWGRVNRHVVGIRQVWSTSTGPGTGRLRRGRG